MVPIVMVRKKGTKNFRFSSFLFTRCFYISVGSVRMIFDSTPLDRLAPANSGLNLLSSILDHLLLFVLSP